MRGHFAHLPEKDVRRVVKQQLAPFLRIATHPVLDDLSTDLMWLKDALPHKLLPHRPILMPVLAGISHAQFGSVWQIYPARSLYLKEKLFDGVLDPGDFKPPACKRVAFQQFPAA